MTTPDVAAWVKTVRAAMWRNQDPDPDDLSALDSLEEKAAALEEMRRQNAWLIKANEEVQRYADGRLEEMRRERDEAKQAVGDWEELEKALREIKDMPNRRRQNAELERENVVWRNEAVSQQERYLAEKARVRELEAQLRIVSEDAVNLLAQIEELEAALREIKDMPNRLLYPRIARRIAHRALEEK